MVGAVQGARKGHDPNATPQAESTAFGQVALNVIQGTIISGVTGMMVGGPVGAVVNVATDAVNSGAGVYVFVKNGSAKVVGQDLAEAINKSVKPGEGLLKGMVKGAFTGGVTGLKTAAKTGFREGKGITAGIIDGVGEVNKEFARVKPPRKNLLKAAAGVALGAAQAVLSAPTGLALSFFYNRKDPDATLKPAARMAIAGATGAATGAAIGSLAGPVGAAVGACVGAVTNLVGPASKKIFQQRVNRSLRRVRRKNSDMGNDVSNNNRNMVQGIIVGSVAGARHGWDSGVSL